MTACAGCGTPSYSAARNCASCPAFSEWPIDSDAPAERKPSAGWVEGDGALPGDIMLHVGRCIAAAGPGGSWVVTMLAKSVDGAPAMTVVAQGKASSRIAAQLAAEDSLLAIAAEIVGAVRR